MGTKTKSYVKERLYLDAAGIQSLVVEAQLSDAAREEAIWVPVASGTQENVASEIDRVASI